MFQPNMESGEVYVNFNNNFTKLIVGSKLGYSLYSLDSINSLNKICESREKKVILIEHCPKASLLAIVSTQLRHLKFYNYEQKKEVDCYQFLNKIRAVKLNNKHVVIVFDESITIHDRKSAKKRYTIEHTARNPEGVCALSTYSYFAYPRSETTGEVELFDIVNFHKKRTISAHDSRIAALAFSPCGTKIATASERGNFIRIFSCFDGTKLYEFLRGFKQNVSMACLSFSTCGEYLVSNSNTVTVHIFRLAPADENTANKLMGYFGKVASNYLPAPVANIFCPRSFASVTLPKAGIGRKCGIVNIQNELRLVVASQDGYLYLYSVPTVPGAGCRLIKIHNLVPNDDSSENDFEVLPHSLNN